MNGSEAPLPIFGAWAAGDELRASAQVGEAERLDAERADVGVADLDLHPVELDAVGGIDADAHVARHARRGLARAALEDLRERDGEREHGPALLGALRPGEAQRRLAGDGHPEELAARRERDRLLLVALLAGRELHLQVALVELDAERGEADVLHLELAGGSPPPAP